MFFICNKILRNFSKASFEKGETNKYPNVNAIAIAFQFANLLKVI